MLHLPDISEFEPNVDWAKVVKQSGGGAVIRAMYGANHVDKAWYNGAWAGVGTCDCSIFDGDVDGLLAKISAPVPAPPA